MDSERAEVVRMQYKPPLIFFPNQIQRLTFLKQTSEAFGRVDTYVFEQLWRMVRRRHQNKTKGWLIKKCWSASGKHVFSFVHKYKKKTRILKVIRVSSIGIKRHIKIKAEANPYFPEYSHYFWRRKNIKEARLLGALSHRQYQDVIASR